MTQKQENIHFLNQHCKKHPQHILQYICDEQKCNYFLQFQCIQCQKQNKTNHSHQCKKINLFINTLYHQKISKLTYHIKKYLSNYTKLLTLPIQQLINNIQYLYSPLNQTTTQKQFITFIENPNQWHKIQQLTSIKNNYIQSTLTQYYTKHKKQLSQITSTISLNLNQLKYKINNLQWKFDKNNIHNLLSLNDIKNKIVYKNNYQQIYCIALLNQPITPIKNQITFHVHSQHLKDQHIIIGLCQKQYIIKNHFQTNLKNGIYAIYQASKTNTSHNAFSLHSTDPSMHYKQSVGWNFQTGDSITINLSKIENGAMRILFKKKKQKQQFQLFIHNSHSFLYPFVALFSYGDRVSIDSNQY